MTNTITDKLKFWIHSGLVVGLVVLLVALVNKINPINTAENSFIETLELVVMFGVLVVWMMAAVAAMRSGLSDRAGTAAASIGVAAVAFGGLGREVTWGRVYGLNEQWVDALTLVSAVIVLAALAASVLLFTFVLRQRLAFVWRVLKSHATGWILFAIVLFAVGMAFEDNLFGIEPHVLYEEVFETLSYACLLVAGLVVYRYKSFVDLGSLVPLTRHDLRGVFTSDTLD